ncbi:MAG: hemolysin family protein [Candidatus Kryptoniota bacterium]
MIGHIIGLFFLFLLSSAAWAIGLSDEQTERGKLNRITFCIIAVAISVLSFALFVDQIKALTAVAISIYSLVTLGPLLAGSAFRFWFAKYRITYVLNKLLRVKPSESDRDEIIDEILDKTAQSGEIDNLERELIESVLKFSDKIVREVMVPRADIVAIDIDQDSKKILRKVIEEGYSRLPVYRGSIDNVIGIIYAKDLLTMFDSDSVLVLQDLLRAPYYVPETKKISQLLREMQKDKVHLAVVVDEFGGTEGIVTLEDILEEIVGEIQDEYDESTKEIIHGKDEELYVSGSMTVERFNELFESNVPHAEDYDTIAGFVQKLAGKLPQKGETYRHENIFFTVEDVARHRIKRLRISHEEARPAESQTMHDTGERSSSMEFKKEIFTIDVDSEVKAVKGKSARSVRVNRKGHTARKKKKKK